MGQCLFWRANRKCELPPSFIHPFIGIRKPVLVQELNQKCTFYLTTERVKSLYVLPFGFVFNAFEKDGCCWLVERGQRPLRDFIVGTEFLRFIRKYQVSLGSLPYVIGFLVSFTTLTYHGKQAVARRLWPGWLVWHARMGQCISACTQARTHASSRARVRTHKHTRARSHNKHLG